MIMTDLPRFRRMIKAIGNEDFKNTAYRYELVEFGLPKGGFIRRPDVFIKDTEMRADGDRLYEMEDGQGGWVLISKAEFDSYKALWDSLRRDLGLGPIDEMGDSI